MYISESSNKWKYQLETTLICREIKQQGILQNTNCQAIKITEGPFYHIKQTFSYIISKLDEYIDKYIQTTCNWLQTHFIEYMVHYCR